jgi:hypothetical protein
VQVTVKNPARPRSLVLCCACITYIPFYFSRSLPSSLCRPLLCACACYVPSNPHIVLDFNQLMVFWSAAAHTLNSYISNWALWRYIHTAWAVYRDASTVHWAFHTLQSSTLAPREFPLQKIREAAPKRFLQEKTSPMCRRAASAGPARQMMFCIVFSFISSLLFHIVYRPCGICIVKEKRNAEKVYSMRYITNSRRCCW